MSAAIEYRAVPDRSGNYVHIERHTSNASNVVAWWVPIAKAQQVIDELNQRIAK